MVKKAKHSLAEDLSLNSFFWLAGAVLLILSLIALALFGNMVWAWVFSYPERVALNLGSLQSLNSEGFDLYEEYMFEFTNYWDNHNSRAHFERVRWSIHARARILESRLALISSEGVFTLKLDVASALNDLRLCSEVNVGNTYCPRRKLDSLQGRFVILESEIGLEKERFD
ncbi:MAG: hypothetical protein GOV15_03915, partial [Candidatus Diapherotrites archaeon]|nr:hypothetical protein [Candidatus Diapherotrites archaeon]